MTKLKLEMDELEVATFETETQAEEVRGTVLGASDELSCIALCTFTCMPDQFDQEFNG